MKNLKRKNGNATIYLVIIVALVVVLAFLYIRLNWQRFKVEAGFGFAVAVIVVVSFVIMKVHLYIGLNAMRAAKGREHKEGYFVAAIIIAVLSVLCLFTYKEAFKNIERIDTTMASLLVDITTIYILIMVIVSSIRIKRIKGDS